MKIPEVIFKTRIGDNKSLGGGCSIGGKWKDVAQQAVMVKKPPASTKLNAVLLSAEIKNRSRV